MNIVFICLIYCEIMFLNIIFNKIGGSFGDLIDVGLIKLILYTPPSNFTGALNLSAAIVDDTGSIIGPEIVYVVGKCTFMFNLVGVVFLLVIFCWYN